MVLTAVERQQASRRMSRQPQQQRGSGHVPESLVEVKSKVSVLVEEPGDSGTDRPAVRSLVPPSRILWLLLCCYILVPVNSVVPRVRVATFKCPSWKSAWKCTRAHARTRQVQEKAEKSWCHVSGLMSLCVDLNHQFQLLFVALRLFTLQLSFVFQKMKQMLVAAFFWQPLGC